MFALKKIKQRAKKGRNKSTLDIVIFDDFSCVAFEWKKSKEEGFFLCCINIKKKKRRKKNVRLVFCIDGQPTYVYHHLTML